MHPPSAEEFLQRYLAGLSGRSLEIIYERVERGERTEEFETVRLTPEGHEVRLRISRTRRAGWSHAERAPERPERHELVRRTRLLWLLEDLALALREAVTAQEGVRTTLRQVCEHMVWQIGHSHRITDDLIQPDDIWYLAPDVDAERFRERTMEGPFEPDFGVLGRVLAAGEPAIVPDLRGDPDWRRPEAIEAGLRSGAFFPVRVDKDIRMILEFFSRRTIAEDPDLLRVLENVALQLGQFVRERETEERIARLADEEQRMLGRELHDVIGQQIAAIGMLGQTLRRKLEMRAAPEALDAERLLDSIEDAKREVRRLAEGLVSGRAQTDLLAALRDVVERSEEIYGMRCDLTYAEELEREIGTAASHLVRIAQEAIRNAVEHGRASEVGLSVRPEGDSVILRIEDNGSGLPGGTMPEGAGFVIMRQRAQLIGGEFSVEPGPTGGVRVSCRIPRERWGSGRTE